MGGPGVAAAPAFGGRLAIEAEGLEKTFTKKRSIREIVKRPFGPAEPIHALRGVDLSMREGEIFALLGPNGAGKTTLLKILSCLVLPDRGHARIAGIDTLEENRVKPLLGLVHSDERSFYWRLSARDNLRFFARLYDVPSRRIETRIEELLRRVDMLDAADRPFADYSSGMKQRIAIARALLHDPPILLMDEPTKSLDPASSLALRSFILDELSRRDGKTILLATHNLREAEALADQLAILVAGRVRQRGTVAEVRRHGIDRPRYRIELNASADPLVGPFRVESDQAADGRRIAVVLLDEGASWEAMVRALLDARLTVQSCDSMELDLEEAFSRIVAAERVGP